MNTDNESTSPRSPSDRAGRRHGTPSRYPGDTDPADDTPATIGTPAWIGIAVAVLVVIAIVVAHLSGVIGPGIH